MGCHTAGFQFYLTLYCTHRHRVFGPRLHIEQSVFALIPNGVCIGSLVLHNLYDDVDDPEGLCILVAISAGEVEYTSHARDQPCFGYYFSALSLNERYENDSMGT
jgi:hypothetical protein